MEGKLFLAALADPHPYKAVGVVNDTSCDRHLESLVAETTKIGEFNIFLKIPMVNFVRSVTKVM